MRSTVFICEYAANHMLIPGQIENWVMITNSRHVSMLFLPSEMKKVINVMSDNYRSKLYINYIIDIHDGTMTKQIRRDNIEEKFGGTAKDLIPGKDNLFPPAMPKTKCLLDNEKEVEILISKEEYLTRMKNKTIDTISPYVIQEIKEEEEAKEKERQTERIKEEKKQ